MNHTLRQRHAWRSATVAAALNFLGMPLELVIGQDIPGLPRWAPLSSSFVGLVLLCVLLLFRRRASVRACSIVFVLNAAAIMASFWVTNVAYAAGPRPIMPFQANKLGALAVALLAPELWAGLVCIAGYTGTAVLRLWLFDADVRARLASGEPWVLVAYTFMAIALLVYRLRGLEMERKALGAEAAAASKEHVARSLLAVRDLANTPLQTIELVGSLIRLRDPKLAPLVDRIDRALAKLRGLNVVLSREAATDDHGPPSGGQSGA